jgi:hypothetical protein
MVIHGFKNDYDILFVAFELSIPCCKTSTLAFQESLAVTLSIGCSQILFTEHSNNCSRQPLDTLDGLNLTHGQVVINKISRDAVCQHAQCGGDLLDGAMAKISDIIPLLKKSIAPHDTFTNGVKQLDIHSKTPVKITFQINWIIHIVAPHQLVVPFDPLLP